MSTKLAGYSETVICPYNKCHVILKERIQTHLVKCARSYPNIQLEICPFNATHRFRAEDKARHMEECSSREIFDRLHYQVGNSVTSNNAPVAPSSQSRPRLQVSNDCEENWDHYDFPTYDPQNYAKNANVLRSVPLLQPSERRKFADEERKRLSELERRRQPRNHRRDDSN
ncbi:gametocyte-specific factor 1 homolog [Contarinia nasturtii]|uniref:gametocyte-specific factor 1 homolog n=1 Tax=Contarinia nasturtii TaxID=265458 RepID=UPI0012D4B8EC|nr:gametocyte-specific factor 1 homolog [Contarinia nasturtii]